MKALCLQLWLAKKFGDFDAIINARRDIRRHMWQNLMFKDPGKGNRWKRRLRQMESEFRANGGGYLSDLI